MSRVLSSLIMVLILLVSAQQSFSRNLKNSLPTLLETKVIACYFGQVPKECKNQDGTNADGTICCNENQACIVSSFGKQCK